MAATLKTEVVQNPSSATVNLTLDASGGVAAGQNLSVTGTTTLTGAVTLSTNATSSGTVVMSSPYTMRNKIINGAMVIDQRNNGAAVTNTYPVDRFLPQYGSGTLTFQQTTSVVPTGFPYALGATVTSAGTRNAADYFILVQNIEGLNILDLGFGALGATTITLSFWVRSSVTGTYSGVLASGDNNRAYAFTYSIPSANTWTQISVTIAGDTSGGQTAYPINNTAGLRLKFDLGSGSNYQISAGSWQAAVNKTSASGTVGWAQTAGATFYITGVQLERGTVATPFEYRNYQQELAMCQRYFYKTTPSWRGVWNSTVQINRIGGIHPVTMRATPSLTINTSLSVFDGNNTGTINAVAINYSTSDVGEIDANAATGTFTAGRPAIIYQSGTGSLSVSAEL